MKGLHEVVHRDEQAQGFMGQNAHTRLKTHRLFQVDIDRREQCCAANYEQVVNHVVPSCSS
jgi:hypothetical protein